MCLYIYMYVCMYVYIYIYTHMHTYGKVVKSPVPTTSGSGVDEFRFPLSGLRIATCTKGRPTPCSGRGGDGLKPDFSEANLLNQTMNQIESL